MTSRSSRRKNGSSINSDTLAPFLRDGGQIRKLTPELEAAAEHICSLGMATTERWSYVVCANARDRDYGESNHYCSGEILLVDSLDEEGGELVCPDCDRSVYPERYGKQCFETLHTWVSQEGVGAYVLARLSETGESVREIAKGVYRVETLGPMGVLVCIADHCGDDQYLAHDLAAKIPICYVVVNSEKVSRFLQEDWLNPVSLADVVAGDVDLGETVRSLASDGWQPKVTQASLPVFPDGPIAITPRPSQPKARQFVVEVGLDQVRVDGQTVIAPQAGPRLHVFRILWERFFRDCLDGRPTDDFQAVGLDELMDGLEELTGKEFADPEAVRQIVNRLRAGIEKSVKQNLGHPIDKDDVIQMCRSGGQSKGGNGYRINPFTVSIRPFQADHSQT